MKVYYFSNYSDDLFHLKPAADFTKNSSKEILATALGATLYCPAVRPNLIQDMEKMFTRGARSIVICLEDSIPDNKVIEAEQNVHKFLEQLQKDNTLVNRFPLLFIRVRSPEHLKTIASQNHGLFNPVTGFVFPKFDRTPQEYLKAYAVSAAQDKTFPQYVMPVLESTEIMSKPHRLENLVNISHALKTYEQNVLAIRIGATDMSSLYGIRRSADYTIYDVKILSDVISDIVNVFGVEYVITGAVWEHFQNERLFKPLLRSTIFEEVETPLREKIVRMGDDSFIKEIQLDKVNGILGKTIIHPSHIPIVNALNVVSFEEYQDASQIVQHKTDNNNGATSSFYKNKMNEIKPHLNWAHKTLLRAKVYGVSKEGVEFVSFLEEDKEINA